MKGNSCTDASRVPPTISTDCSMTDTGGTQALRHADAAGPIAVPTVGEEWFVPAPSLEMVRPPLEPRLRDRKIMYKNKNMNTKP